MSGSTDATGAACIPVQFDEVARAGGEAEREVRENAKSNGDDSNNREMWVFIEREVR